MQDLLILYFVLWLLFLLEIDDYVFSLGEDFSDGQTKKD